MKKIIYIIMVLFLTAASASFGQDKGANPNAGRTNQANLYNEFSVSYGAGSMLYFVDHEGLGATSAPGTFSLGYSRTLNKTINVGFQVSYAPIKRTRAEYNYSGYSYTNVNDNYWQGMVNVRFRYVNKPSFCMYSAVGLGVVMNSYTYTNNNVTDGKDQQLFPSGQLTFLGIRAGRALAFFAEFGVGTVSIINAGLSYKFGDDF